MTDHQHHIQTDNFDDFPVKLAHALHLKLSDMITALKNAPDLDEGIEEYLN